MSQIKFLSIINNLINYIYMHYTYIIKLSRTIKSLLLLELYIP